MSHTRPGDAAYIIRMWGCVTMVSPRVASHLGNRMNWKREAGGSQETCAVHVTSIFHHDLPGQAQTHQSARPPKAVRKVRDGPIAQDHCP